MNFQKISVIILSLILIVFTCGCDTAAEEYVLYFELDEKPSTLDPQLASGVAEELLVRNMFEGLTRLDSDGNVVNGVAEKVNISDDGLVYVFTLREGAKWSNGEKVTADDFVFAFERAIDPNTKAPSVSLLYSIKNAEEISLGKAKGELGVSALDNGNLQIVLKEPDSNFLNTLTSSICMPCNRQTFNDAKGKYGMNEDDIVCNGSYSMGYWNTEDTFGLRINKNENYSGKFTSEAKAVVFSVGELENRAEKMNKNSVDMGFVDITAEANNFEVKTFSKTCYALLVNGESSYGKEEFKKSIMSSVHKNLLSSEMGVGLTSTDILIPQTVEEQGISLCSRCSARQSVVYDPQFARESYLSGVGKYGDPGNIELVYYGSESVKQMAMLLAENLQQSLGVVANIKSTATESELINNISSGEYTLAIVPITAQSKSIRGYLSYFCSENIANIYGFSGKRYDDLVNSLTAAASIEVIENTVNEALGIINDSLIIMPLANLTEGFGYATGYKCPEISPFNGVIDLALVRK